MVAETRVRRSPEFEAAQEAYIDLLTQQVGRAPGSQITDAQGNVIGTVPTLAQLGPQVATQNASGRTVEQRTLCVQEQAMSA